MSRGFVTIATGNERYYCLARNLLYSYRQFASQRYPFAIICDKENHYTEEFDDVVIMENAHCNYLDKLQLYNYLPYDETIFIDADSLAYGDLDEWWSFFDDADDFSLFGYAWTDLNAGRGWFHPEDVKEFQENITFIPDFNGGVYYLRRRETCQSVFKLANDIAKHYHEYRFTDFVEPADEPCLALAMAVHNCRPKDVLEKGLAFAPKKRAIELDIAVPKAHFHRTKTQSYDVNLIHWSNYRTKLATYRFEVEKLFILRGQSSIKPGTIWYKLLYKYKLRYPILCWGNMGAYYNRIVNKLRRLRSGRR